MKTREWRIEDGGWRTRSVVEYGGKRSATPLSELAASEPKRRRRCPPSAVPLRRTGALPCALYHFTETISSFPFPGLRPPSPHFVGRGQGEGLVLIPAEFHCEMVLDASGGREQRASGSPSPPLEERAGERRPITLLDAAARGDMPAGCRTNISGGLPKHDHLLSLSLSSKGGEGNGAASEPKRRRRCALPAQSKTWRLWPVCFCFLLSAFCFQAWGQTYSLDWQTIDGGGGTSTGGVYSVTGTIGQPDAGGAMTGGNYSLTGGFWSLYAVQTPGAPYLWVMRTTTNTVCVWWALSDTAWQLQATTNLVTAGSIWTEYSYQTNGVTCCRIESPPTGNRFYRLRK